MTKIMHVEYIHTVYADVRVSLDQSEFMRRRYPHCLRRRTCTLSQSKFTNFNPAGGYIKSGGTRLTLVAEENSSIVWLGNFKP